MPLTTVESVAEMLRWGVPERSKYLAQLPAYVDAASQWVEDTHGPFEDRQVTYVADGGRSIALPLRPRLVTSVMVASAPASGSSAIEVVDGYIVEVDGVTAPSGWTVDLNAGIVYGDFPAGRQNVTVTYRVGALTIQPNVELAATMLAAHLWQVASQRDPSATNQEWAVPTGFAVPNRVKELLAPEYGLPGFA